MPTTHKGRETEVADLPVAFSETMGSKLPQGRFNGRSEFQQLVRDALSAAANEGWSEIILSDANFADWPLGESAVEQSLQAWARKGRRMTLLACDYGDMVRRHARFVRWRRTWDHILTCRASLASMAADVPSALWSPAWVLQRIDPVRCAGVTLGEPGRCVLLHQTLTEWLNSKSAPAFSATVLGL